MKLFSKLWEKVKNFWNIYGGITISTFIAWLTEWSKVEMDRWSSYLILTITCISLLTFFKVVVFKKKPNGVPDSAALSQKSVRTLKNAIEPEKSGEEIGNVIITTIKGGKKFMKKLKNFLKEIWGNKLTLSNTIIVLFFATLSQIMTYTEYIYRINWFNEHKLVIQIASPIVALIWVFIDLYTTYTKYGFESLKELADRKASKLSKEEKKKFKEQLTSLESALSAAKSRYGNVVRTISDIETLMNANYAISSSERGAYEEAKVSKASLEQAIEKLQSEIVEIKEKL